MFAPLLAADTLDTGLTSIAGKMFSAVQPIVLLGIAFVVIVVVARDAIQWFGAYHNAGSYSDWNSEKNSMATAKGAAVNAGVTIALGVLAIVTITNGATIFQAIAQFASNTIAPVSNGQDPYAAFKFGAVDLTGMAHAIVNIGKLAIAAFLVFSIARNSFTYLTAGRHQGDSSAATAKMKRAAMHMGEAFVVAVIGWVMLDQGIPLILSLAGAVGNVANSATPAGNGGFIHLATPALHLLGLA